MCSHSYDRQHWKAASLLASVFLTSFASAQGPAAPPLAQPTETTTTGSVPGPVAMAADVYQVGGESSFAWSKVPPPSQPPRLGGFPIFPNGPGYYSLIDQIRGEYREKPPIFPFPPFGFDLVPFFNNNFNYLDNPENTHHDYMDPLKRIHIGENWLLSFGGEARIRYNSEVDSRLSGKNNTFESERGRVYGDLWYRDIFRIYAEYDYSNVTDQDLRPAPTDVNKSNMLNLFMDLKLFELDDHPAYLRVGRQELNYGSQRLISKTDFPNSPRDFDGVKGFYRGENLDVDFFLTRPVVISPDRFNSVNDKASFDGFWATYRPAKGQMVDLYYLYLDNDTPLTAVRQKTNRGGFDVNTIGSRYTGDKDMLVWDFEGMYQFGQHAAQNTSAAAFTTAAGIHLADVPMNPLLWVSYDYASGSQNPGKGDYGTFNQLFPNGHGYFGWTDLVGRQNIEDLSFQAWLFPTNWITTTLQYHFLSLDSAKDGLFNPGGALERISPTGKAGTDVGNVFTAGVNFHLTLHSDVLFQYSHLQAGDFIKNTGSPLSPDFFYAQYTYRW